MSPGQEPLEVIGTVRILAPRGTGKTGCYYRLEWVNLDGTRGDTSGGRTLEGARWKNPLVAHNDAPPENATAQEDGHL